MKNISIYVSVLLLLFTSCNSINSKIIAEYKKQSSANDSCIVSILNLANFEWDKLYVFPHDGMDSKTFPESINKILIHENELCSKLIFTLNDSVVYYEKHSIDIERVKKNAVVFEIPDTSDYQIYTKEKAIFKVIKGESPVPYYYLQQIE